MPQPPPPPRGVAPPRPAPRPSPQPASTRRMCQQPPMLGLSATSGATAWSHGLTGPAAGSEHRSSVRMLHGRSGHGGRVLLADDRRAPCQGDMARATAARLRVEGAAFSHFTAARLLGIDVRHSDPAVWLRAPVASGHRSWPGVHVTRSRHSAEPVLVHGQPVTPAARTVVDLAGRLHDAQLTGMLYDVMRQCVATAEQVTA